MSNRSLFWRLSGAAVVWAVLLLISGAIALTALYRATVFRDVDDRLDGALFSILASIDVDGSGVLVNRPPADPRFTLTYSGRYWVVARAGSDGELTLEERSRSLWDGALEIEPDWVRTVVGSIGELHSGYGVGPGDARLRVRGEAIRLSQFPEPLVVIVAEDISAASRDVRVFAIRAMWMLGAFGAALVAVVAAQVRWGLAPVRRMEEALAEVRTGARSKLDADAPVELAPLVDELNAVLDHNRDVVEKARAHVGNLAHALKTPIAVLVNESKGDAGPLADLVQSQTQSMVEQVDHHLKRASAAARAHNLSARTDVATVIADLERTLPRMYPDRSLALSVDVAPELVFRGEGQDLQEIVGNLLDNAFKWARSRITVEARAATSGDRLLIDVCDDGPGLPDDLKEMALLRGARLDEAAPGTGLGLAIVSDLASAYGGALHLEHSELGGLRARVLLPRATVRLG